MNLSYEELMKLLKPVLERVAADPEFRDQLEQDPVKTLSSVGVRLDDQTRGEFEGKRFSEFWVARKEAYESSIGVRRSLTGDDQLTEDQLDALAGGTVRAKLSGFAPPYVPVGPSRRRGT